MTMDAIFGRPVPCRPTLMPVPPTMQFTVKMADDVVNTRFRQDDRVPMSRSSLTAVRSAGCRK
jgi:hypothetical protein